MPAPPRTPAQVLRDLKSLAPKLNTATGKRDDLLRQRRELFTEGKALEVPERTLAEAAGVRQPVVRMAVRRGRQAEENNGSDG